MRCRRCATTYVHEQVSAEQLDAFYASYYDEDTPTIPTVVENRVTGIVSSFAPFRQTGHLVDIGFGGGTLLSASSDAGWTSWGTEVSSSAIAAADASWVVHQGDVASLDLPAGQFDVVCMVELLEHVAEPAAQLAAALRLLRPGGLLYGTTPSARGISARCLGVRWSAFTPPEHLQLFSPKGLRSALRSSGFATADVTTRGVNPHELMAGLRHRTVQPDDRVASGYRLNMQLESSRAGRVARTSANSVLQALRLGDSLKLRAIK